MKYFCARNEIIEENEVMLPRIPKFINTIYKGKSKVVPLQAQKGPEGSRKLSFPDFVIAAQDGGKVASLTHRLPLPPGNTHFC